MNQIKKVIFIFASLITFSCCMAADGIGKKFSEYEIKAGYLFNFLYFVEWPKADLMSSQLPFSICIIGENPFGDILSELETRKVRNRNVTVFEITELNELSSCHLVYISQSESFRLNELLYITNNKSILSVSDISEFSIKGGDIEFFDSKDKIRLRINLQIIKNKGLKVSAKLLEVSIIVG